MRRRIRSFECLHRVDCRPPRTTADRHPILRLLRSETALRGPAAVSLKLQFDCHLPDSADGRQQSVARCCWTSAQDLEADLQLSACQRNRRRFSPCSTAEVLTYQAPSPLARCCAKRGRSGPAWHWAGRSGKARTWRRLEPPIAPFLPHRKKKGARRRR